MGQAEEITPTPVVLGVWPDDYLHHDEKGVYVDGPEYGDFKDFSTRLAEALPEDLKDSGCFLIRWTNRTWRGLAGSAVEDTDERCQLLKSQRKDPVRIEKLLELITPNSEYTLTAQKPLSSEEFFHLKLTISHHDVPMGERWFITKLKKEDEDDK